MNRLALDDTNPTFHHWLRQRYLQIIILVSLLMVDVVMTYLFIEVYHTSYEQNPFMAPVLELPYGYVILTLLKFLVVLLVAGTSWRAYRGLHSDKHSEKAKEQAHKLEVWLWWLAMGLTAVLDFMLLVNVNQTLLGQDRNNYILIIHYIESQEIISWSILI